MASISQLLNDVLFFNLYFKIYPNGYLSPKDDQKSWYSFDTTKSTWIAPYYRMFVGVCTVYYRETNEASLLQQVNSDIHRNSSTSFKATNLFLVTFISQGMKFQVTLATDWAQTYAVLNYEELSYYPIRNIDMNEAGCEHKVLVPRTNDINSYLLNSKISTGVRGRHVFNLTISGCFKNNLRVYKENDKGSLSNLFSQIHRKLPPISVLGDQRDVLFHLKEAVTYSSNPIVVTVSRESSVGLDEFNSYYGVFNPGRVSNVVINNLFILKNTPTPSSFQYGDLYFGKLASREICRQFSFKHKMVSIPSIKVSASVSNNQITNFVNVWLKNVSTVGFTACVKEMIAFSGSREVYINFIAATPGSIFTKESTHIDHQSTTDDLSDTCFFKNLENMYHLPPYIFTSVETPGNASTNDEPALAWVKHISNTTATVCVRSSQRGLIRIHLIIKGTISSCSVFSCPSHLECQLTSNMTPYCGCIRNCSHDEKNELCGSDFNNYQSVCMMNKKHCQSFGNDTKSILTVRHYEKCQGKINYYGIQDKFI